MIRLAAAAAVVAVPAALVAAPAMAAPVTSDSQIRLVDNDRNHCNSWNDNDFCRRHGPGDWRHRPGGGDNDWDNDQPPAQPMPATGSAM
ncbi:hypothetical protein CRH09_38245 [Nocardia terpenica]|uniref:Secreted protein n=1 Tax=Nocardia terpenica TaxID=455432 RepID=A0A291RU94_9NOCA|nr:hypothetical protein CRH09_38245 [Nocardia terpenica]